VAASAQSVDVASNSTRVQLVVDNSRGELMTGDFTTVTFDLAHPDVAINVPASALIFNKNGLHVAIVDHEGKIVLKEVTITRDLGNEVEIGSGIAPDDRVVANPPDGIASGDQVRIAGAPGKPGQPETAEAK
jgi:multidrug efflux pump subunit AcrA (membrane-fusion protein)